MTPTDTPQGYVPTVTADLLERVAADPEWSARVLCAAANALNTLSGTAHPDGMIRPGAEHFGARETLLHAFTDWDRVRALLFPDTAPVALQPTDS